MGSDGYEHATAVAALADGCYAVAGIAFESEATRAVLYRLDSEGRPVWSRSYTVEGGGATSAMDLLVAADGGFILAGSCYMEPSGDAWIMKTDREGNKLWARTWGDSTSGEMANAVRLAHGGGYVVAGESFRQVTAGSVISDSAFVFVVSDAGTIRWGRKFGGDEIRVRANDIVSAGGGYVWVGIVLGHGSDEDDWDASAYGAVIDQSGDLLRSATFGESGQRDAPTVFNAVAEGTGGTYFAVGSGACCPRPGLVVGLDINLDRVFVSSLSSATLNDVCVSSDGSATAVGGTDPPAGDADVAVYRVSPSGQTVWTADFGGPGYDCAEAVAATPDGGVIIVGNTSSFEDGDHDIYIIKLSAQDIQAGPPFSVADCQRTRIMY